MVADKAIKHVVLLMLENRSFDQMLGCLQAVFPDLDGVDASSLSPRFNVDSSGNKVYQAPTTEQQLVRDPAHETVDVLNQLANHSSGFVRNFEANVKGNTSKDRRNVMGYYPLDFLPALHQLGRNFTVCDRWYSSMPGPTWPNRFFALTGTSQGRVLMPGGLRDLRPVEIVAQDQNTVFDRLNEAGRTSRIYYYDFPVSLVLSHQRHPANLTNYSLIQNFFSDARVEEGFPDFVFIEPKYLGADQNDNHPPHNIFKAEKLVADVYNAIRSNLALWESSLLLITYDEHGGFYDHVEPPTATSPDSHREEWTFDRLGVRVPALVVSPWVGAGVSHVEFDHTSLLKYLTDKWELGFLGQRTAAANSLALVLNQESVRKGTPPFIRVPYTVLIPPQPELEQNDLSRHHRAIHAFAACLASEQQELMGDLLQDIAREARAWVRIQAWFGKLLQRIGKSLAKGLQSQRAKKIDATVAVVTRTQAASRDASS